MNHEHISNEQEKHVNSDYEQAFSEKETQEKKSVKHPELLGRAAMRFFWLTGFSKIRKNPELFEDFIQSLDVKTATDYLKRLNGMLRGSNFKDRGYYPGMQIDDHLAPYPEIQEANYASALDTIKQIQNPRYRAALAFYTINNMHTFHDGNGRTSRAVFEILENPDFDLDQSFYRHEDGEEVGDRNGFEREKHLHDVKIANMVVYKIMTDNLAQDGEIDSRLGEAFNFKLMTGEMGFEPRIHFTPEADSELTEHQKGEISHSFVDRDIAKFALCEVLQEKGTAERVIDESINSNPRFFNVNIAVDEDDDPESSKRTFSGWTVKDYAHYMQNYFSTQVQVQQTLNDIFLHPERYPLSDEKIQQTVGYVSRYVFPRVKQESSENQTLADWLTSRP